MLLDNIKHVTVHKVNHPNIPKKLPLAINSDFALNMFTKPPDLPICILIHILRIPRRTFHSMDNLNQFHWKQHGKTMVSGRDFPNKTNP